MSEIKIFLIGVLVGVMVFAAAIIAIPGSAIREYHTAIDSCQEDLPRNQTCEIFAKPAGN
jgi:hypothetical protein